MREQSPLLNIGLITAILKQDGNIFGRDRALDITLVEMKDKITEQIGTIDAATLERAMEGVLSRACSCVVHNGCHLTDVVFHAWKYKTSVLSLSFEVSFVLIGAIERSHDKNKSASRLLGHPVYAYRPLLV